MFFAKNCAIMLTYKTESKTGVVQCFPSHHPSDNEDSVLPKRKDGLSVSSIIRQKDSQKDMGNFSPYSKLNTYTSTYNYSIDLQELHILS